MVFRLQRFSTLPNFSNGDTRLNLAVKSPYVRIEARALRNVKVGEFHAPARLGIFAGNEAGTGGFTHASLLRYDFNHERHKSAFSGFIEKQTFPPLLTTCDHVVLVHCPRRAK